MEWYQLRCSSIARWSPKLFNIHFSIRMPASTLSVKNSKERYVNIYSELLASNDSPMRCLPFSCLVFGIVAIGIVSYVVVTNNHNNYKPLPEYEYMKYLFELRVKD